MGLKLIFTLISVFILIPLLIFYFIPSSTFHFAMQPQNSNFSVIEGNSDMQYYPNMRFPSNDISYRISNCPLQKENDMEYAFEIMNNITNLKFNSVLYNEEISITCEEKERYNDGGLFIAGEGGPTNITVAENFNVITHGEILLIKHSNCPKPNVATHELLHVLGFGHSNNPNNIMYNITNCEQTLSDDVLNLIDKIYSVPSYPDLIIKNVSGLIKGRFLELNFSVLNGGLQDAGESRVIVYAEDKIVEEIELSSLKIGSGRLISTKNIWIPQINVKELTVVINSDFDEITKENNNVTLKIN
jgi:hypothetical protein